MNKKDKIILIICAVFVVIAIIIAIVANQKKEPEKKVVEKVLTEVIDKQEFFEVNMNVNNFYNYLSFKKNLIVSVINPDYLDNVNNLTSKEYGSTTFFSKKIYSFKNDDIYYYFICGDLINNLDKLNLEKDLNYFMIVDNKRVTYNIMPIDGFSITQFFNNYVIEPDYKISLNDGNMYLKHEFFNEEYAMSYINYFRYLLITDPKTVYNNYLDYNYKIKFKNYDDFYSKRVKLANNIQLISSTFREESYSDYLAYILDFSNGSYIILKEYAIMDYKLIYSEKIIQ